VRTRTARLAVVIAGAALLMGGAAVPAAAVGTNGVELTPLLDRGADGLLALDASAAEATLVAVRNTVDEPRRVRVYTVAAARGADGGFTVAGEGSVPWLTIDAAELELGPLEERMLGVTVDRSGLGRREREGEVFAAFVLEAISGPTLVTRAASVVKVSDSVPLPSRLVPLLLALTLLMAVAAALGRHVRVRQAAVRAR
jgi:hypothetical protein